MKGCKRRGAGDCLRTFSSEGRVTRVPDFSAMLERLGTRVTRPSGVLRQCGRAGASAVTLTSLRPCRTLRVLMAEPKENPLMEKIVSLCKRRGFIYQSSEIYGGINGFWDYGPLGAELKRNVKELWWNTMTRQRDDVVGLGATIILSPDIWKASGHVDTFADLMRECPLTKKRVRADQVEPQNGTAYHYVGAIDIGYIVEEAT